MHVGGDLGALLGADAHQALLGEVLGHPDQPGPGEQGHADEDGEGGGQYVAELGGGAPYDDEDGEADADQCDTGEPPDELEEAPPAAYGLVPVGAAGVVGLPPHEDHAGADQQRRPHVPAGGAADLDLGDEDAGADEEGYERGDLPAVGFAQAPAAVGERLEEGAVPAAAADTERYEDPERGVQQDAEAVPPHEQAEEGEPDPDHGQPQVPGETARDTAEHPAVGAAVELALRRFFGVRCERDTGGGGYGHVTKGHMRGRGAASGHPPSSIGGISGLRQGRARCRGPGRAVTMDP